MESLQNHNQKEPKNYAGFAIGGIAGLLLIAVSAYFLFQQPSRQEQLDAIMKDALTEGMQGFSDLSKDVIITTGDNTVVSPNAFGTISMYIHGTARNNGDRRISVLEVNSAVIDIEGKVVKEKKMLVVPTQRPYLGPGDEMRLTLTIDGFKPEDDRANIRWNVVAIKAE